jgi:hypothetical protein
VRYDAPVAHTVLRFFLGVLLASSAVAGFEQALDRRLIDDATAIGQSRIEAVRTRYHQPYRIQVARPPLDYVDIVTPFRRVVLLAEERVRAGARLFGQREAMAALGDRSDVVEVLIEMTFHPLNVFIGVPAYDVELAIGSPVTRINPLHISRVPRFGARVDSVPLPYPAAPNLPGVSQPLVGGTIVAGFGAGTLNPNGVYEVVVSEKGKELARARVNLGALR